jgi:hypothetical protein
MSNNRIIQTPKLPDSVIFEIFDNLSAEFASPAAYRLFSSQSQNSSSEELRKLGLSAGTEQVEYATTNGSGFTVTFHRGVRNPSQGQRLPSIYFDEIDISPHSHDARIETLVRINKIVDDQLSKLRLNLPQGNSDSDLSIVQQSHRQLSALLSEISRRYDKREKDAEAHRKSLEDGYIKMRQQLEEAAENRRQELEKRDEELRARAKELDDRDNTHVRRELRGRITETLRQRLKEPLITSSTRRNSFAFLVGCTAAGIGLIYLGLWSQAAIATSQDLTSKWFAILKSILFSAAGVGFFGYAVFWLRKLYLDDSRQERELERYALDLDRASWAIETILDMSKKDGAELPSAWVQGVCRDLFAFGATKEDPTALQALGAIMDVAAGAEIGTDGAKITLNRRGAKAVAESAK